MGAERRGSGQLVDAGRANGARPSVDASDARIVRCRPRAWRASPRNHRSCVGYARSCGRARRRAAGRVPSVHPKAGSVSAWPRWAAEGLPSVQCSRGASFLRRHGVVASSRGLLEAATALGGGEDRVGRKKGSGEARHPAAGAVVLARCTPGLRRRLTRRPSRRPHRGRRTHGDLSGRQSVAA